MSTAPPPPSSEVIPACLLLLAPDGRRMMVRDPSGRIPIFKVTPVFYPEVEELVERVRSECGPDIAILRCLAEGDANEGKPRLYSAVSLSDGELRPGFRWSDLDEPSFDEGVRENLAGIARLEVERLSSNSETDSPVPWDSPTNWHRRARNWIQGNLPQAGDGQSWRIAQIRSWSISSVFRISSGGRRLYFKASPRYFDTEVAVTQDVSNRLPEASPEILSAEPEQGWMLMNDLGDITLAKADRMELWHDAMKTIANVQRGYIGRTDELERMGVERRSIGQIVKTLVEWTQDPSRAGLRLFQPEAEVQLKRLDANLDRIEAMALSLEELGLPQTLEHGDLDSTNIFIRNGVPVLMDWSDACISHPFFTPLTPAQARRYPELVDTYLGEWSSYGSISALRSGFEMAKVMVALESTFHYHRNIVPYLPYPYPDFRTLEKYIPALLQMAVDSVEYIVAGS